MRLYTLGILASLFHWSASQEACVGRMDWFDCEGRVGDLIHPSDCTKFVKCDDSGRAWEWNCGSCITNPQDCTEQGRLVFNETQDKCWWPSGTDCVVGGGGSGKVSEGCEGAGDGNSAARKAFSTLICVFYFIMISLPFVFQK